MRKLSDLIGTTPDSIKSAILDAHLNDAALRNLSASEVSQKLKSIRVQTAKLQESLSAIDVGAKGSGHLAGLRLEFELDAQQVDGSLNLIPEYVQLLKDLIAAADGAIKRIKPRRGPQGAGGNPAFDRFIESLVMAALQRNVELTIGRATDGVWQGTLLEVVQTLEPYLPSGFFPSGELGRSIEHIRSKLYKRITKNTT
jgi:hypothetical protein